MYYPSATIEEDEIKPPAFIDFIFEVIDNNQVPSRITINSTAFLIGGMFNKKDDEKHGINVTIEESVAECAVEIINSIEDDFTILNTYHR